MKKIVTIAIAASMMLAGTSAFAQVSIGVGYLNNTNRQGVPSDHETVNTNGVYLGLGYNAYLGSSVSFNPGLYVSYRGAKNQDWYYALASQYLEADSRIQEWDLNLPLNFRYNFDIAPDCRLFIYAGPTLVYGLSSKNKVKSSNNTVESLLNLLGGSESDNYEDGDYSRFDVRLGGGIGFELSDMIQATLGYKYGVINRYNGDLDVTSHNSTINLGVAFLF